MSKVRIAFVLAIVGLSGILYGIGSSGSAMSVSLPYLRETTAFTSAQLSLLVGACMLGAVVSGLFAGPLADWIGRKRSFVVAAALFAAGSPALALSNGTYSVMMGAMLVQGLGIGIFGIVSPLYLAEVLPPRMRGKGTGFFQLVIIVGIVLSGLFGLALSSWIGPPDSTALSLAAKTRCWQIVFGCVSLPALLVLICSFFLGESPVWLGGKAKGDGQLRQSSPDARPQLPDSLFSRRYIVPFVLAFTILVCNQTTGINAVLAYSVTIFREAGLRGAFANGADSIFKVAMLFATVAACALVDRKGRVYLLKLGTAGIVASMVVAGLVMLGVRAGAFAASPATGWTVAAALVVFISSFAVGPGVCVWLALTELMPSRIRAVGMSVALVANQGVATALQATMLPLTDRIGYGWLFLFFALCTVGYWMTVSFFLPETKGRTLEDIEKEWM